MLCQASVQLQANGSRCRLSRQSKQQRLGHTRYASKFTVRAAANKGSPVSAPQETTEIPSYLQPPASEESAAQQANPQYYQAVPQYLQAAPPARSSPPPTFWSQIPPLIWIGIGILVANGFNTAMGIFKGGPQKMQQMAMEQMMNQMMKQAMGGSGGMPPGGNPFAGGAGGMPAGFPFAPPPSAAKGAASGFPSGFPQAPIDTTATPAPPKPSATSASSTATKPETSSSTSTSSKPKKSAFVDVDAAPSTSDGSTSTTTETAPPSFDASAFTMPPPPSSGDSSTTTTEGTPGASGMLDMLRNPEMQKMLYPYLPEPMRNPDTFEWMLNNPEYRQQLEGMLSQQMGSGAPPAVQELMQGVDMNPDKMKEQFDALGMSPEEFIQKVMSDPELATSMTKPSVMAAIAECTKNPMNIFKYQNDEEVMKVFEKMSSLFPQAAMMGGMGGMPPGMTPPPSQ